ncbi:hypothetical protein HMPREF9306_01230 [Propionimicrobium lymphophilum ACS-093-V-SCH5]|uniref:Uncharacterized protein n=1 Tax=Propionimicrobium lymphophilum ACS-093-V-SCH5 TaxID=883161 RepID=S2WJT4_9ACTN|nr:hypothetical protein [Propionimicrobium lymphophilum]EPD32922.1 hypothetical protein HMPREF9306_01230 [Propionimicrobium lymphophilum ACS-093-V-SCH5]
MTRIIVPDDLTGVAAAASLTQAVLKHLNVASLEELACELEAGYGDGSSVVEKFEAIEFSPGQRELLATYADEICLIRNKPRGRRDVKSRTLAVCDACGGWVVSVGNPPARCQVKLGCGGRVTKPPQSAVA